MHNPLIAFGYPKIQHHDNCWESRFTVNSIGSVIAVSRDVPAERIYKRKNLVAFVKVFEKIWHASTRT